LVHFYPIWCDKPRKIWQPCSSHRSTVERFWGIPSAIESRRRCGRQVLF
jgi:hypothetical protein